jgi:type IV pilus assembly protein PilF
MRTSILRAIIYSLGLISIFGCVTEQSYIDSDQQARSLAFDKEDAAKSRLLLGLGYLRNKNYPQAKYNLDKALEYAPMRADIHSSLAYYYQAVGDVVKAEQSYQKSLQIGPNNPNTLNNYAVFLCKLTDYDHAIIRFKQAVAIPRYSQIAESYENMALCMLKADYFEDALKSLTQSYQHNPNSSETLLDLISVHYAMGHLSEAFKLYNTYLARSEQNAQSLLMGILLETSAGKHNKAKQYRTRLTSEFPLSHQSLLLSSNLIQESIFEQRKIRYLQIVKQGSKANTQTVKVQKSSKNQEIVKVESKPSSLHSVVGIGKSSPLPSEIIVSQQDDNSKTESVERAPTLDINVDNVEIPSYTVQYGENLYRVSLKFNVQISALVKWNKLKSQQVNSGDKLFVQNPDVFYTVKQSKDLSAIADELNIPLAKLMAWNKVKHDGLVAVGTKILKVEVE